MDSSKGSRECRDHRPKGHYSHFQEIADNLPYILMVLLGAAILSMGFGPVLLGIASSALFILYGIVSTLWILVFVCPYCHYYDTRSCPCGYGQIAAMLRKKQAMERFNEKFRRHIYFIVPMWIVPVIAGIIFLILDLSWPMIVLLFLFIIDSFLVLPLVSRKYGCAHCPQKDTCPWMRRKKGE